MRVFAIKNEEEKNKPVAYLVYYERNKMFYIELVDGITEWDVPFILDSFVKRGEKTVSPYWSKQWVRQRIVPPDRQNIASILKDNGLSEYDEFALLMLGNGRCAQDYYYLEEVKIEEMEQRVLNRMSSRVEDVIPLSNCEVLTFFCDGITKKVNVSSLLEGKREYTPILQQEDIFRKVRVMTGGYGICWGERHQIMDYTLYHNGEEISISKDVFVNFAKSRMLDTSQVAEKLHCSRQYVNKLVKQEKILPVRTSEKSTIFLASDIEERMWN